MAIDFPTVNVLGFVCYTVYAGAFLYSPVIQHQYAARHPVSQEPTVRFNDFAFALHAVVLSGLVYSQFWPSIWGFKVSRFQRVSKPIAGLFWGSFVAVAVVICIVLAKSPDEGYEPLSWAWIDVVSTTNWELYAMLDLFLGLSDIRSQIYALSYVKLVITVVKYVPQAWVNYKRKSTRGWSIAQILLDFTGGVLSLVQLIIDSAFQNDWSGITGNPIKFLLSNVTIFFDLIFMVQHYILYRNAENEDKRNNPDENSPLLSDPDERGANALAA